MGRKKIAIEKIQDSRLRIVSSTTRSLIFLEFVMSKKKLFKEHSSNANIILLIGHLEQTKERAHQEGHGNLLADRCPSDSHHF